MRHRARVCPQALERTDIAALLLGLLCTPGLAETQAASLQSFYSALLPVCETTEGPWALLNAMLPAATAAHGALILQAIEQMQTAAMPQKCRDAHGAFSQRLQQHLASLG